MSFNVCGGLLSRFLNMTTVTLDEVMIDALLRYIKRWRFVGVGPRHTMLHNLNQRESFKRAFSTVAIVGFC